MADMKPTTNILNRITDFFRNLTRKGNVRKLEVRKPNGTRLFSISLTWAVVIALAAFLTNTLFLIAIAAVVALVLKYQIAMIREN